MKRSRESPPCSILARRCSQSPVSAGDVSGCSPSRRMTFDALLRGDQRAAVALDVADVDQPLDDRRARGRRADAGVLHRLAQLLVVDELARGLHRAQQRRVGVAPRRLGLLLGDGDVARLDVLALLEPGQLLLAALVVVAGGSSPSAHLAVDAAPARHEQHLAAGAEDVLGDRGLDARVLEHRLGMEDGEEAAGDEVVDAPVVVAHLVEVVLGPRRDDRVVVGDLGVVDDARRAAAGPARSRTRRLRGTRLLRPTQRGGRLDLAGSCRRSGSASSCADRSAPCAPRRGAGRRPACAGPRSRSARWPRAAAR